MGAFGRNGRLRKKKKKEQENERAVRRARRTALRVAARSETSDEMFGADTVVMRDGSGVK